MKKCIASPSGVITTYSFKTRILSTFYRVRGNLILRKLHDSALISYLLKNYKICQTKIFPLILKKRDYLYKKELERQLALRRLSNRKSRLTLLTNLFNPKFQVLHCLALLNLYMYE